MSFAEHGVNLFPSSDCSPHGCHLPAGVSLGQERKGTPGLAFPLQPGRESCDHLFSRVKSHHHQGYSISKVSLEKVAECAAYWKVSQKVGSPSSSSQHLPRSELLYVRHFTNAQLLFQRAGGSSKARQSDGRKKPYNANSISRLPQRYSSTTTASALASLGSSGELLGQTASPAPPRLSQEPVIKWSQVV